MSLTFWIFSKIFNFTKIKDLRVRPKGLTKAKRCFFLSAKCRDVQQQRSKVASVRKVQLKMEFVGFMVLKNSTSAVFVLMKLLKHQNTIQNLIVGTFFVPVV